MIPTLYQAIFDTIQQYRTEHNATPAEVADALKRIDQELKLEPAYLSHIEGAGALPGESA